jgi:hypothetical protein
VASRKLGASRSRRAVPRFVTMQTESNPANDVVARLHQLADEIRVRVHLAGMEARDAWAKIEPKLHDVQQRATRAKGKVADEVAQIAKDIETDMRRLRKTLEK